MEQSLQGSIPLRHLLNEEICVDGLTEVKEVNDWAQNFNFLISCQCTQSVTKIFCEKVQ